MCETADQKVAGDPEQHLPQQYSLKQHLIEAKGISVRRGGRWIIRNVDITVGRGEIVTIVGPNGGGKSTTAKALLGLVKADEGTARRDPGLTIGYVPQRFAIDWSLPLTVERLMSLGRQYATSEVEAALRRCGASHLIGQDVGHLSGGEFQRVLLARAIISKPDLLVLDEPVQGVDYAGEIALYELISSLRRELDCGVLLISHDLHIVMAETDSVVCINGHVCCSGTPAQVAGNQAFQQLFGARGTAALAFYHHVHDHSHDGHASPVEDQGPA